MNSSPVLLIQSIAREAFNHIFSIKFNNVSVDWHLAFVLTVELSIERASSKSWMICFNAHVLIYRNDYRMHINQREMNHLQMGNRFGFRARFFFLRFGFYYFAIKSNRIKRNRSQLHLSKPEAEKLYRSNEMSI